MNPPPQKKPMNDLALASLVAGILSWTMAPVVAAVVAIVAGHMARAKIRETGEDGDMFALIGMVLGYVHIVVSCLFIGLFIAMYVGIFAFIGVAQYR
jgi:hypothetical protein